MTRGLTMAAAYADRPCLLLAHSCRQRGRPPRQLSGAKLPLTAFGGGRPPLGDTPFAPITALLGGKLSASSTARGEPVVDAGSMVMARLVTAALLLRRQPPMFRALSVHLL